MRYKNGTIIMRCAKYKTEGCCGTLTTTKKFKVLREHTHTCIQDFAANELAIKMENCKKQAASTNIPVTTIYNNIMVEIEAAGINLLT